ncbi:hypothetical protein MASR2M15_26130 [Anaerolineales bacterium]
MMDNFDNQEDFDNEIEKPGFSDAISVLKTGSGIFNDKIVYGLSGMMPDEFEVFESVWRSLPTVSRLQLLITLREYSLLNFDLDYSVLSLFALEDEDPDIRTAALKLAWENESIPFLHRLRQLISTDPSIQVRVAALDAIAPFISKGEFDDISFDEHHTNQELLAHILQPDSPASIQERAAALMALSHSTFDELNTYIETAYHSSNEIMRLAALTAMANSHDDRWQAIIMDELENQENDIDALIPLIRACGTMELEDAIDKLAEFFVVYTDRDLRILIIETLGEIPSPESGRILQLIAESVDESDEELLDIIDESLALSQLLTDSHFIDNFDD